MNRAVAFRISTSEPPHGKTNNLRRRKQRRRSASRTAKLISGFVFATRIVQFLFYLNPKFQASSCFLCLYRSVCVGPVRKPHCWFSHEAAQVICLGLLLIVHTNERMLLNIKSCFGKWMSVGARKTACGFLRG